MFPDFSQTQCQELFLSLLYKHEIETLQVHTTARRLFGREALLGCAALTLSLRFRQDSWCDHPWALSSAGAGEIIHTFV